LNRWIRLCNRKRLCLLRKTKTTLSDECCLILGTYRKDENWMERKSFLVQLECQQDVVAYIYRSSGNKGRES
jgi:hypothetical protein